MLFYDISCRVHVKSKMLYDQVELHVQEKRNCWGCFAAKERNGNIQTTPEPTTFRVWGEVMPLYKLKLDDRFMR